MTTYEILNHLNKKDRMSLLLDIHLLQIILVAEEINKVTSQQLKEIIAKIVNECN